jgi:actin-like ATPase involved in cell morphogenesis
VIDLAGPEHEKGQAMSAQYVLGVDLGTTFTAAAVAVGDEPPVAVPLGSRAATMPTVAYLGPDGEFLVGEAAERRALTDPDWVVRRFKRRIGDETPLWVGIGAAATRTHAHTLAARVISWVVGQVTIRQGGSPDHVVVTHPVGWGPHKQELLLRSLADLGLTNVRLLTEPEAAALAFAGAGRLPVGALLGVYDLGGGTFDASLLRVEADGLFRPVGRPVGLTDVGGIDFDDAILAHVIDSLGAENVNLDPSDPLVSTALARLRQECVEAKEALSVDTAATVPVLLHPLNTSVRLTRSEFETMIAPAIAATVEALDAALDSLGDGEEISHLLLTGGSSRIPLVTQALSAHLGTGVRLDRDLDPTIAVAMGAALAARPRPEPAPAPASAVLEGVEVAAETPVLVPVPAPARPGAEVLELARPVMPAQKHRSTQLARHLLVVGVVAAAAAGGAIYGLKAVQHQDDPPVAATVQLQEDHPQAAPAVGGPNAAAAPTPTPGATQPSPQAPTVNRPAAPSVSRPVYSRPAVISAPVSRGTRTLADQAAPRRVSASRPAIRPQQQPQRPAAAPAAPAPAAPVAAPADNTSTGSTEFHEAPAAPAKPKPAAPRFSGFGPTAPPAAP